MVKIEIGGGTLLTPGFVNLDPEHGHGVWRRKVQEGIPAEAATVDEVKASHVLEHIPAGSERIGVFNEAHRVLKPGGVFYVIVPLMTGSWHAIADPTHVSFWVPESFLYFDGTFAANASYGIALWRTLTTETLHGFEYHWKGTPA